MKRKIVFLTYHNWETKRQGGFHKLAVEAVKRGYETVFFSFSRPYYTMFKNDERLNANVLFKLAKGEKYSVLSGEIINVTYPTLDFPFLIDRFLPKKVSAFLKTNSFKSFKKFKEKFLNGTTHFVFESNESVLLFNKLKNEFPESKFIYRPSDPIIAQRNNFLIPIEQFVMSKVDWNFIVNRQGEELYLKNNFLKKERYSILPNGIDLKRYNTNYEKPEVLKKTPSVLYLGAIDIEWDLVLYASKKIKEINFVVITPQKPPKNILKAYNESKNISFINGIPAKEVPKYVSNCNAIMVPNVTDRYKKMPWGITAKYYQAMMAKKPIVVYHDTEELKKYGVLCTYTYDDFVNGLKSINLNKKCIYNFEFKDWTKIGEIFFKKIESI